MVNQFLVGLSLVVIVMAIARFGRSSPPEAESQQAVATTGTRVADANSSRRSSDGTDADSSRRSSEGADADSSRRSSEGADADSSRRSSEGAEADLRARETEAKMTDDERFSLIVSVMGAAPLIGIPR